MSYKILAINPGSTSTKISVYEDENKLFSENIEYTNGELDGYGEILEQLDFRTETVKEVLKRHGIEEKDLAAAVGRGGLFPNMKGGGYLVTEGLKDVEKNGKSSPHASNLGAFLADAIAAPLGIPAYIYDAVTSDELQPLARITGMPDVVRGSMCHVLNMKAQARKVAQKYGKKYEDMRLVVAHLGGGISLSAHEGGKIIDVIRDDDGPFSPERAGSVPLLYMIDMCYSGTYTKKEMIKKVRGMGGMKAYLGTSDLRKIEEMINNGDEKAKQILEAQAYQVAKGIGLLSTVLCGQLDCIVLTGGMAYSKMLTDMIIERIKFITNIELMPGEDEMESLSLGALRILKGEEHAQIYGV